MERRRKWWIFPVLLILLAVIVAVSFWDVLAIYIAPKTVLREAFVCAYSQLQQRFDGNPLLFLLNAIDPEGKQTAAIRLDTANELIGDISYDMTVQTDVHKLLAEGTASTSAQDLDLSFYMDTEFIAVSSMDLVGGSYYGITYDTFGEDIRSIPLLDWFIEERILDGWEALLMNIRDRMSRSYTVPQLPEISAEEVEKLTLGLLAIPSDIEKTTVQVNGETLQCHRITYTVSGTQVRDMLDQVMDVGKAESASVTATFYLSEKALVMADALVEAGENTTHFQVELGKNAQLDPLTLFYWKSDGDAVNRFSAQVTSNNTQDSFAEKWHFLLGDQNTGKETDIAYHWDAITGNMTLRVNNGASAALNLTEAGEGFRLETDDFAQLVSAVAENAQLDLKNAGHCILTVRKGTGLTAPDYKNLDQWSLEDFLTLLSGISSLVGWNFL